MGTFLTTPKMAPALAARIEARVRSRHRGSSSKRFAPRLPMFVLLPLLAFGAVVGLSILKRWASAREINGARQEIIDQVRRQRSQLPPDAQSFLPTVESWIARLSAAYEGDWIDPQLRTEGALQARLARKGAYLRGPLATLARSDQLAEAASSSIKDAFLMCLVEPPESRSDKVVLAKVKGADFVSIAPHIRRYHDAEAGLRVLQPQWEQRALSSDDPKVLAKLKAELLRAPIDDAKPAASSDTLIVVIDEPSEDASIPKESDRSHHARVTLVDLRSQSILLRLRRKIDPSSIPAATRAIHGRAIGGCLLALDVRDATRP